MGALLALRCCPVVDDEATVADAYQRMGALVRARCRKILRDHAAADDAMQEAFVRLWRALPAYREATSKLAWMYRVSDRCCFDVLARQRSRRESPMSAEPVQAPPQQAVEDREVVLAFLGRFDPRLQEVAVLHYLDQMTGEEIATATGWSRQTVVKKLQHLKERAAALRPLYLAEARP